MPTPDSLGVYEVAHLRPRRILLDDVVDWRRVYGDAEPACPSGQRDAGR